MGYLKVTYDGFELTDYCTILDAFPYIAKKGEGLIVRFNAVIKRDIQYNLDHLNMILFTDEARPLIISDQPGRYLMAKFEGPIEVSSRNSNALIELEFTSDSSYWLSTEGTKKVEFNSFGTAEVMNNGTAPAIPKFTVDFTSEAGYLGIVGPNGYMSLGDKEQKTFIELPEQQRVMNEEMHQSDMADWVPISSDSHGSGLWIPDYQKLSLTTGKPTFDQWGTRLTQATSPKPGAYWNCFGYVKDMDSIEAEVHNLKNFKLQSRVTFEDRSGKTSNTGMYLIVIMDQNNKPIVTTSIYNVLGNSNEVTVTAKVNDFTTGYRSKIINTAKFPQGIDGAIQMKKEDDNYQWVFDSGRSQSSYTTGSTVERFSTGDTVYIKNSARTAYDHLGNPYPIKSFTRGRPHKTSTKKTVRGRELRLITYQGVSVYWMSENDLTSNRSGVGKTVRQYNNDYQKVKIFNHYSPKLSTLKPSKVFIAGGTWEDTKPFSRTNLTSVVVYKLNQGDRFAKVKNTFAKGDKLVVNHATGEVLHNGLTFQGLIDVDSRFFNLGYGPSELELTTNSWASLPKATVEFKERFR